MAALKADPRTISYSILPERVDTSTIPAEYLVKIWDSLSTLEASQEELPPVSMREVYRKHGANRGWVVQLKRTEESIVIFRSKTNDALFENWSTKDFYLVDSLPLLPEITIKLKNRGRGRPSHRIIKEKL